MPRFQLVFRDAKGERSETRDSNMYGEPRIDGKRIEDGGTYTIHGINWLVRREASHADPPRYICRPSRDPDAYDGAV